MSIYLAILPCLTAKNLFLMEISLFNSLKFTMALLVWSAIISLIYLAIFYATKTADKTITQEA